ncbi:hypothetical protein KKD72_02025 [Patescibacteria group bacterium]|nr:hypothetical protein [Patescibacteria group bacterium]
MADNKLLLPNEGEITSAGRVLWLVVAAVLGVCLIYAAIDFSRPWMQLLARIALILAGGLLSVIGIKKAFRP